MLLLQEKAAAISDTAQLRLGITLTIFLFFPIMFSIDFILIPAAIETIILFSVFGFISCSIPLISHGFAQRKIISELFAASLLSLAVFIPSSFFAFCSFSSFLSLDIILLLSFILLINAVAMFPVPINPIFAILPYSLIFLFK